MCKKYLFPIVFFSMVIIASCITFETRKKLEKYTYDEEIMIDNISIWGKAFKTYITPKSSWYNHQRILLLLSKDKLQYIVSNDLKKTIRYKYVLLQDSIHILSKESNPVLFDRFGQGDRDSIVASNNIIVQKKGYFSRRANYNESSTTSINVYVNEGAFAYKYKLFNNGNQYIGQLSTQNVLARFQQQKLQIQSGVKFVIDQTIPMTTQNEESFFRKQIMHF